MEETMKTKIEGTFIESRPVVAGLPLWIMRLKLDNGKETFIKNSYDEIRQCIQTLQIKPGDRVRVKQNGDWEVEKL